jgi:hypothetical protein
MSSSPNPYVTVRPSKLAAEGDFYFVQVEDPETAVARIIELVKTRIPKRFGSIPSATSKCYT